MYAVLGAGRGVRVCEEGRPCNPSIPALEKLNQKGREFKANLSYISRTFFQNKTDTFKNKTNKKNPKRI